jgi:hypothetical protein
MALYQHYGYTSDTSLQNRCYLHKSQCPCLRTAPPSLWRAALSGAAATGCISLSTETIPGRNSGSPTAVAISSRTASRAALLSYVMNLLDGKGDETEEFVTGAATRAGVLSEGR